MPRPRANPHKRHWRTWYSMAIWHSIRRQQLLREPLCRACSEAGRVKAATEVDHIVAHGGDWNVFITGALQSLCGDCHRRKSSLAHRQSKGFDEHGGPLDPNHWWNSADNA